MFAILRSQNGSCPVARKAAENTDYRFKLGRSRLGSRLQPLTGIMFDGYNQTKCGRVALKDLFYLGLNDI